MTALTVCSTCTASETNPPVNGITPNMPTGWSTITIAERGRSIRNFLLCRTCTSAVRAVVSRLNEAHRDAVTASPSAVPA